jgi:hypothetical protein
MKSVVLYTIESGTERYVYFVASFHHLKGMMLGERSEEEVETRGIQTFCFVCRANK